MNREEATLCLGKVIQLQHVSSCCAILGRMADVNRCRQGLLSSSSRNQQKLSNSKDWWKISLSY